jgi:hypothetical protein
MAVIWFSHEDRERMRREKAEMAEIGAEYDRICARYARIARRPETPAERERELREMQVRDRLQIRPRNAPER